MLLTCLSSCGAESGLVVDGADQEGTEHDPSRIGAHAADSGVRAPREKYLDSGEGWIPPKEKDTEGADVRGCGPDKLGQCGADGASALDAEGELTQDDAAWEDRTGRPDKRDCVELSGDAGWDGAALSEGCATELDVDSIWCSAGLCWTLEDPTRMVLEEATAYCADLKSHGLKWRLPSIDEWLGVSRGCNHETGLPVEDVEFVSTCVALPCERSCPLLKGPNPHGCYWPTELGHCQGVPENHSTGRYWSSSDGIWFQPTSAWAFTLSSLEPLNVRCVATDSEI